MKFYFVNPRTPVSFSGNEWASPIVFRKYTIPPVGLLTIAAMVPREHEIKFCDENAQSIDWNSDCEFVCLTGMHLQKKRIHQIATRFRELGKRIIIGGPSVMAVPEQYRDVADILIVGEAEYIWPECLKDLAKGTAKDTYLEKGTVALEDSPIPRYDLVSPRDYMGISLQTTRGCPFTCEFCDIITLYGRKVRFKPVAQVMKEIEVIIALGTESINIVDDNFIGNQRYAAELLEAFIDFRRRQKRPFYFTCQLTINVAKKPRLVRLLHEAGCRSVFIGIETPRVSSLEETHKMQNARSDLVKDVEKIQREGIAVYSGLIVGFDHDDKDIFKEQVDFINEARIPSALPNQLGALPGTPLYQRMIDEGRLLPNKDFHMVSVQTNIRPKQMTMKELNDGYVWMLKEMYSPDNYADRVLGQVERISGSGARSSNYNSVIIYMAFMWVLLWYITDPNRRVLLKAFFKVFPRAVTRYRNAADTALVHLIHFRHFTRFINVLEEELRETPPLSPVLESRLETSSDGRL